MAVRVNRLADLSGRYSTFLCDVWGVVHNGVSAYAEAGAALSSARAAGITVVLITNSPRRHDGVARQLDALGVARECYDRIVTSGDVTRKLIAEGPPAIFFLGPDRDRELLDGLTVRCVAAEAAQAVVCTGFFDDENEGPDDYDGLLKAFRARDVPMICANPDVVVERGDRLIYCAGALAARYREMGGETRIAGKPHRPIYEAAMAAVADKRGKAEPASTLAIGDGAATDLRGGENFGLDTLFVTAGIHGGEYTGADGVDEARLAQFLAENALAPRFWMPKLG